MTNRVGFLRTVLTVLGLFAITVPVGAQGRRVLASKELKAPELTVSLDTEEPTIQGPIDFTVTVTNPNNGVVLCVDELRILNPEQSAVHEQSAPRNSSGHVACINERAQYSGSFITGGVVSDATATLWNTLVWTSTKTDRIRANVSYHYFSFNNDTLFGWGSIPATTRFHYVSPTWVPFVGIVIGALLFSWLRRNRAPKGRRVGVLGVLNDWTWAVVGACVVWLLSTYAPDKLPITVQVKDVLGGMFLGLVSGKFARDVGAFLFGSNRPATPRAPT